MRFYCPKCDLKYRIDDDKFAQQPNAQMRCKGCHAVFSVQAAIKLGNERKADGRPPLDGAPNLSLPPPKPGPMAWKSTMPAAQSHAGKGVVTMPLLDVTARPKGEPAKQVNAKGGGATKPGLAPNTRGLLVGPKIGQRGAGASSLLATKGLRGAGERPSLPQIKLTSERPPIPESTRSVQVLGRGSAMGFPPVTEERTFPAVPPLPRLVNEAAVETELAKVASVQPALVQPAPRQPEVAPAFGVEPEHATVEGDELEFLANDLELAEAEVDNHEEPIDDFDSALAVSESVPPLTPLMTQGVQAAPAEQAAQWAEAEGPFGFTFAESEPLALEVATEPARPAFGAPFDTAIHGTGVARGTSPNGGAGAVGVSRWDNVEQNLSQPPARSGVSLGVAMAVSLLCTAAGFTGGFFAGSKSERSMARAEAAVVADTRTTPVPNNPAPPPPPEQDVALNQPVGPADPGAPEHVSRNKLTAKSGEVRVVGVAPSTPEAGNEALALDGLSNVGSGPGGPQSAGAAGVASEAGLTAASIQATVQRFQPAIRRMCWQPALSRHGGGSGAARVTTMVAIAPAGKVTAVTHEGDPAGYPGLASCIALRVKTWKFQRSAAPTTVKIPFVFAAQ